MSGLLARGAAIALLVLTLAACGGDDEPTADPTDPGSSMSATQETAESATETTPSTKPTRKPKPTIPADAPRCEEVWVAGATLPGGYQGCVTGQGKARKYVKAAVLSCSSGQGIVRYDDRFWAVRGGAITMAPKILDSDEYLAAVARCRG